jgi:phosphonate transport system substrate-binding protein
MNAAHGASPEPSARMTNGSERGLRQWGRPALYFGLALVVVIMGRALYLASQESATMRRGQDRLVANHGLLPPGRKRLSPDYADANGDLVADPPAEQTRWVDPETLVVAHYLGDEADADPLDWQGFQAALAQATGKKVVLQEYLNSANEVAEIKNGTIHVVALHSADTPYVVNHAGFVPVAVLGSAGGATGNHLAITVSRDSSLRELGDLRGRKLTCTRPDSITGYRAAIAVLSQKLGMRPDVDYTINFSHGQTRSILGLIAGEFQVAALSDDKLQSLLKTSEIKPEDYRVLYESQVIPRLTFGHVYNLSPELAANVRAAALGFENQHGAADELAGQPLRFIAIDYKKDFEFVRQIDDRFDPRFHKWSKIHTAPETTTPQQVSAGS